MKCSAKSKKRKYLYEIRSFTHQKFHVDYLAVSLSVDFQLKNPGEILSLYTILMENYIEGVSCSPHIAIELICKKYISIK